MARQLFWLIILLGGIWLLMDEVYGKKTLSQFVTKVEGSAA